ncbi:DUF2490 domain-containing protein [Ulvibacterium sp.]|uniref:DUF2490 domain-containing protein n=1 Tax=Ulvibacterium sp. TaxID=2665914 RepID=UPI0026316A1A|nr:DUF2490 domain-containing protein [Ulvibacterium sp.]
MATRLLCPTIVLFISLNSFSQREREEILGTWLVASGSHQVSENISIPTIGILRYYEPFHHYELSFFRTGICYGFSPRLSGTLGYGYLNSEPFIQSKEAKGAFYQHWLYSQLTFKDKMGSFNISHRYRLENRWINTTEGTELRHRMRYRLKASYPLSLRFYLCASNEIFIALQEPLFNQNRLYFGIGYKFNSSLHLETGFMKNHFSNANYEYLRIEFIFKTDFRKKHKA